MYVQIIKNENIQMLSTTVFEKMMWTDNRLVWDKDDFEGIDRIQVNAEEVK